MKLLTVALACLLVAGCAPSSRFLWEEYTQSAMDAVAAKRYDRAEAFFNRAARKAEEVGPEELGRSLNGLGEVYRLQGRARDAEQMFERALAVKETALGRDHPDVATTLTNLALVYVAEGRPASAVPLLERSLIIHEKAPGPGSPSLTRTLATLAEVYRQMGRADEARPLEQRARRLRDAPRER